MSAVLPFPIPAVMPKLLLVDDRAENLFALQRVLAPLAVEVHTAGSGDEALGLLLEYAYAAVVLDVQMPDMDGFEVAALMRAHTATKDIPIIFVTAISKEHQYRMRGYEVGAVDYLLKPIDPDILNAKVKVFVELETRRLMIEQAMRGLEVLTNRNELILSCAQEGVIGLGAHAEIVFANDAAGRTLGLRSADVIGMPGRDLFVDRDDGAEILGRVLNSDARQQALERTFNRADGSEVEVELTLGGVVLETHDDAIAGVMTFRDVTERKRAAEKLLRLARYDQLTGLANRALYYDALHAALARADRRHDLLAVLVVDLDNFKLINDSDGHDAGDKVLAAAAMCMDEAVRTGDLVARTGGDEFAVILESCGDAAAAEIVAQKIIDAMLTNTTLATAAAPVTCSIGIATSGEEGLSAADLTKRADKAMYAAKEMGRACVVQYSSTIDTDSARRTQIVGALEQAIESEALTVAFQGQYRARDRQLVGHEALVRWDDPALGPVSPGEFIPIAEKTGQIAKLGEVVMRKAMCEYAAWRRATGLDLRLALNVSAFQLGERHFPDTVLALLARYELPPAAIELELTETAMMRDPQGAGACMGLLRSHGMHWSVDDFGTGYASLSHLQQFPVSSLKIDRSFTHRIGHSKGDDALVTAIIRLGVELDMLVVGEGVETDAQADYLTAQGCHVLQGYLFDRPGALPA